MYKRQLLITRNVKDKKGTASVIGGAIAGLFFQAEDGIRDAA
ncbi:hypothetical protein JMUB7516_27180 [Staphylococcus aureus]